MKFQKCHYEEKKNPPQITSKINVLINFIFLVFFKSYVFGNAIIIYAHKSKLNHVDDFLLP